MYEKNFNRLIIIEASVASHTRNHTVSHDVWRWLSPPFFHLGDLGCFCFTGCPKKKTLFWSLITASDFKIQTSTLNYSKKEVFNFLFDVSFRPFRETHCVKGCDKNVSIFLIVCRKMVYLLISLKSEFIWPPRSPDLSSLDFYLSTNIKILKFKSGI